MKTFKQFNEELPDPVTPKQLDVVKSDLRFIRTPEIRKKENQKFRSLYPFPRSKSNSVSIMKTFKQFNEDLSKPVTPKQLDVFKSDLRFIRTPDIRKKENQKFRSLYPFPRSMLDLVKKKTDTKTA